MKAKNTYKAIVIAFFLVPNVFVMLVGIESFPYTCAPMFGHYINKDTKLYLFKLEGVNQGKSTDLIDYLGKPEDFFMRHFFSKVYGSTDAISPFTNKLSESETAFQNRMTLFFDKYSRVLKEKYTLSFEQIQLKVVRVNQDRKPLSPPQIVGYYDCLSKTYTSAYKNAALTSQLRTNGKQ